MKQKTLKRWFQACLVGSAVAGGCNRQEVPIARNESDLLSPVSAWTQRDPKATTGSLKRSDSALVPTGYSVAEKPQLVQGMETLPASELPPVVIADPQAPLTSETPAPTMPSPLALETMAAAAPVSFEVPKSGMTRTTAEPARSAASVSRMQSMSRYGHAPD